MSAFLQIIRWKNLLIVFATSWLVYWILSVDSSVCEIFAIHQYLLLTLSLICITAAGNVHNDICDVKIDRINKPHRHFVDVVFSRTQSWLIAGGFLVVGLLATLYLTWRFSSPEWTFYYLLFTLLLYSYNRFFKCFPLIGNVVVAGMCGAIVLVPFFLNCPSVSFDQTATMSLSRYLPAFAFFAFIVNLLREITKDLEDIQGDRARNCHTLATVLNEHTTRIICLIVVMLFQVSVIFFFVTMIGSMPSAYVLFSFFLLFIPLLIFLYHFTMKRDYTKAQNWLKVILLLGLIVLVVLSQL